MKLIIHIDGGSRGNPGPAACGVMIDDISNQIPLLYAGFFLGRMTNNVAEYHGLIKALELAVKFQPEEIEILSDSQLMVRQIHGQYKVKAPQLKPLYDQAMRLLDLFPKRSIQHVCREANHQADALANRAMDRKAHVVEIDRRHLLPVHVPEPQKKVITKPTQVLAEFVSDPGTSGTECPVQDAMEHHFAFTAVTPAGMCLHAAHSVLGVLTGDGPLPKQIACKHCRAKISLTGLP